VGNFTAAAETLARQGVGVKLGLLQVRPTTADAPPDAAFHALRKRYSVGDLPEIKIFDRGQPLDYAAAADVDSIVDVARWNAGRSTVPTPTSRVVPLLGTEQLRRLLQPSSGLVLLVFRARWCTRCLVLEPQLHTASVRLAATAASVSISAAASAAAAASAQAPPVSHSSQEHARVHARNEHAQRREIVRTGDDRDGRHR